MAHDSKLATMGFMIPLVMSAPTVVELVARHGQPVRRVDPSSDPRERAIDSSLLAVDGRATSREGDRLRARTRKETPGHARRYPGTHTMKARQDPVRATGKAKPKSKVASRPKPPRKSAKSEPTGDAEPAARLIDARIGDLSGWRGETLARMRSLILKADPGITEEWSVHTLVVARRDRLHREAYSKS